MQAAPLTSIVGSYSSTKWFWMSCIVSALFPTPPAPTTTSLYSVIFQPTPAQDLQEQPDLQGETRPPRQESRGHRWEAGKGREAGDVCGFHGDLQ